MECNYYIFNNERFSNVLSYYKVFNNYILITLSTYLAIIWELSFSFLIWSKKYKYYILLLGLTIHLGIYFVMMIHDFEILFLSTYILFFSDEELLIFRNKFINKIEYVQERLLNGTNRKFF